MIPNKFLCSVALCALLLSAQNTRRFPQANLVSVKAAPDHLLGKSFMPGGALATYKKGKVEWTLFAAQCPNAVDAAIRLPDNADDLLHTASFMLHVSGPSLGPRH